MYLLNRKIIIIIKKSFQHLFIFIISCSSFLSRGTLKFVTENLVTQWRGREGRSWFSFLFLFYWASEKSNYRNFLFLFIDLFHIYCFFLYSFVLCQGVDFLKRVGLDFFGSGFLNFEVFSGGFQGYTSTFKKSKLFIQKTQSQGNTEKNSKIFPKIFSSIQKT